MIALIRKATAFLLGAFLTLCTLGLIKIERSASPSHQGPGDETAIERVVDE